MRIAIGLVLFAGAAANAQLDFEKPLELGQPILVANGQAERVWTVAPAAPSIEAGLDGNVYSLNHAVADSETPQLLSATRTAVFNSPGQSGSFPLDSGGSLGRALFSNPSSPLWGNTPEAASRVPDAPTLEVLPLDSDFEPSPGTHHITIRTWYSTDGTSIYPFAQPSSEDDPRFTPTLPGVNDHIPTLQRHPVGLGGDIGDAANGFGGNGLGPPEGMIWDQAGTNEVTDWLLLGFRQIDGAFVGVSFANVAPDITFNGNGELVVGLRIVQPADLPLNPESGLPDLTLGTGPIAWGDGITSALLVYGLQYSFTATAVPDGVPCPGDIADELGFPAPDGAVGFGDFLFLLSQSGPCNSPCSGDIATSNGFPGSDGVVNFGDFLYLLSQAGPCP